MPTTNLPLNPTLVIPLPMSNIIVDWSIPLELVSPLSVDPLEIDAKEDIEAMILTKTKKTKKKIQNKQSECTNLVSNSKIGCARTE